MVVSMTRVYETIKDTTDKLKVRDIPILIFFLVAATIVLAFTSSISQSKEENILYIGIIYILSISAIVDGMYFLVYTNLSSQSLILSLVLLIMGLFGIIFETFIIVKERRRDE